MNKFLASLKKAVATFVFATSGYIIGTGVFGFDIVVWQAALATGIGALLNLAYRWSESVLRGK